MGTIFVAGTYGVGKSTLCNKLSTNHESLSQPIMKIGY